MDQKANNFAIGEVYSSAAGVETDKSINYFVYRPDGTLVSSYQSFWANPSGMSARRDAAGVSYFREGTVIYFGPGRI